MENTQLRYLKKAMAARRVRVTARERQCQCCGRYTFGAMRCGACKEAYYCGPGCQAVYARPISFILLCDACAADERQYMLGMAGREKSAYALCRSTKRILAHTTSSVDVG
eukprot:1195488-Prorocentrum_minimum.AAC.3